MSKPTPKKTTTKPKRPKGAPTKYNPELGDKICELMIDGRGLHSIGEEIGVNAGTIMRWCIKHNEFRDNYARACEERMQTLSERIYKLLDDGHAVACDPECGNTRLQAVKLEIDTIKWLLVKLMPKKYGDRSSVEMTGAEGAPLVPEPVPQGQLAELAGMIASARDKISHDA